MKSLLILLIMLGNLSYQAQTKKTMTDNNTNPLLCDPEKGMCEIPTTQANNKSEYKSNGQKPVKIIYFTDPICSSCWGIEPQLRKLKLEYGNDIQIDYRMGGLLPDWSYNSGGISKPSDVAHHWDEVSRYYDMPIDGNVWFEDPLSSSFPPSIAFKAAQMQDELKAIQFLRRIREMVFLEKKNITKWEHLSNAASETGLDTLQFKRDYEFGAKELFQQDLELAKQLGVRGFPILFFIDSLNHQQTVYGFKPYQVFENALTITYPKASKKKYDSSWMNLFKEYPTLTAREFSELSGIEKTESERILEQLVKEGKLHNMITKNGSLWILIQI